MSSQSARLLATADTIRADLATNVAQTVRWHDAMTAMDERGMRLYIETPPGQTLTNLAARNFPDSRSLSMSMTRLDSVRAALRQVSEGNEFNRA
jgi:malonate decarboxylase epsilon subunit